MKLAVTVPPEISAQSHVALRQPVVRLLREVAELKRIVARQRRRGRSLVRPVYSTVCRSLVRM